MSDLWRFYRDVLPRSDSSFVSLGFCWHALFFMFSSSQHPLPAYCWACQEPGESWSELLDAGESLQREKQFLFSAALFVWLKMNWRPKPPSESSVLVHIATQFDQQTSGFIIRVEFVAWIQFCTFRSAKNLCRLNNPNYKMLDNLLVNRVSFIFF